MRKTREGSRAIWHLQRTYIQQPPGCNTLADTLSAANPLVPLCKCGKRGAPSRKRATTSRSPSQRGGRPRQWLVEGSGLCTAERAVPPAGGNQRRVGAGRCGSAPATLAPPETQHCGLGAFDSAESGQRPGVAVHGAYSEHEPAAVLLAWAGARLCRRPGRRGARRARMDSAPPHADAGTH